jgi:hypothetical protein
LKNKYKKEAKNSFFTKVKKSENTIVGIIYMRNIESNRSTEAKKFVIRNKLLEVEVRFEINFLKVLIELKKYKGIIFNC